VNDDSTRRAQPVIPTPGDPVRPDANAPIPSEERAGVDDDGTIDLDAIAAELDDVEAALARLADGTYWTDEVTGEPIPAERLDADPTARRA
jgi:RNA polymerase-binding transcription factor DksA